MVSYLSAVVHTIVWSLLRMELPLLSEVVNLARLSDRFGQFDPNEIWNEFTLEYSRLCESGGFRGESRETSLLRDAIGVPLVAASNGESVLDAFRRMRYRDYYDDFGMGQFTLNTERQAVGALNALMVALMNRRVLDAHYHDQLAR